MSIEITSNYSNYAANYADIVKKQDSKAAAASLTAAGERTVPS